MEFLEDGPARARHRVLLAHGAGAPMDSPFMNDIAGRIGRAGIRVLRFEFPYMRARRTEGKRRGPDSKAVLFASFREAIECCGGGERLVIGGKSMGGRYASMLADEVGARGLICLGYPFHAPGRSEKGRIEHLRDMRTPALFIQGTRDSMGTRDEAAGYTLSPKIAFRWMEDGDHSFKPRKASGRTSAQAMDEAVEASVEFVRGL